MARARFVPSGIFPYHVGARCINKEWFKIPLPIVWDIFSDYLYFIHHAYKVDILSFVLMSNHFHLLLSTPEQNLAEAMNYFMRETSRLISKECGRINQIYGGPYHRSLIKSELYYMHAYKYIYRNPVEAELCQKVEDYCFSTLQGLLGKSCLYIPLCEDTLIFNGNSIENHLRWLNTSYEKKRKNEIQRALRRQTFGFAKDRENKKPSPLETELF